jgi:chemotaxis protein CheX
MADAPAAAVVLPPVLDLAAAAPLLQTLKARQGAPVTLDAAEVRRLGAQCLQVLLAAHRSWTEDGHAFAVLAPSPAFTDALAQFGAAGALEPVAA